MKGKFGPLSPEKSACIHFFQSCKEIQIEGWITCYEFLFNYQGSINEIWQKSKKKEQKMKYSFKEIILSMFQSKNAKREGLLAFTF